MPIEDADIEQMDLAKRLLEDAEAGFKAGQVSLSLETLENAINILFEIGEYIDIVDTVSRFVNYFSPEVPIFELISRVENLIRRFEKLDLPEEVARLNLLLAKVAFQRRLFKDAGANYENAANMFLKADPEQYNDTAALILIRAGECYEKYEKSTDYGEILALRAILSLAKVSRPLQDLQKEAFAAILKKDYETAEKEFAQVAEAVKSAIEKIKSLPVLKTVPTLRKNVQARLLHLYSEYLEARMIVLLALNRLEESKQIARDIAINLCEAISLLNEVIAEDYDTEDLRRLSFDVFLSQFVQQVHKLDVCNPIQLALDKLSPQQVKIIESQRFFKFTRILVEKGFKLVIEDILNTFAGTLDRIKRPLLAIVSKFLKMEQ